MPRSVFSLLLLVAVLPAAHAADIYMCERDGKKEFSQQPCGANATVMKDTTEPTAISVFTGMPGKDITKLCQLVIQAKDRNAATTAFDNNSRRYLRRYNYSSYPSSRNSESNSPQAYVLSHITNLEQLAGKSPRTYDMVKELVHMVNYQGYERTTLYHAERAAALSKCEQYVSQQLNYISRNED